MPLTAQRAAFLSRRNAAAIGEEPWLARLRARVLACGGDEGILLAGDSDTTDLLARGSVRGVEGAQARRWESAGPPGFCHRNATTAFLRDPARRSIVTGFCEERG